MREEEQLSMDEIGWGLGGDADVWRGQRVGADTLYSSLHAVRPSVRVVRLPNRQSSCASFDRDAA